MPIIKDTRAQLRELRKRNAMLEEQMAAAEATLAYVAMMADVDIDTEDEEEMGNE